MRWVSSLLLAAAAVKAQGNDDDFDILDWVDPLIGTVNGGKF